MTGVQTCALPILDEWLAVEKDFSPYAIRKNDYHDFEYYLEKLETKEGEKPGLVPHERPATASAIPKSSAEKMQEVKRPATAPTSKGSEPVKTTVIKERPLSSGASDRKATQPTQQIHRQNVEKVVSQETRQNDTKDRRTKVQQTQSVQKNQQTIEKTRNLVTKKGQKKK